MSGFYLVYVLRISKALTVTKTMMVTDDGDNHDNGKGAGQLGPAEKGFLPLNSPKYFLYNLFNNDAHMALFKFKRKPSYVFRSYLTQDTSQRCHNFFVSPQTPCLSNIKMLEVK